MKKLVSIFLTGCMILSMSTVAIAGNINSEITNEEDSIDEIVNAVSKIPVYITYLKSEENDVDQAVKEAANLDIEEATISETEAEYIELSDQPMRINASDYQIMELDSQEVEDMVSNVVYTNVFKDAKEMLEQGTTVNYINIYAYAPETEIMTAKANDLNDPAYWERNYPALGTVDGYKFRYGESATNVESSWKDSNNVKTTTDWTSIVKMAINTVISRSDFTGLKKINFAKTVLSTLWKSQVPPYKVTFGKASGYLKTKVSGTLYSRSIIIEDKLNRVKGHAYYPWGSSQLFTATQKFDIKYPTSKRTENTYNYKTFTTTGTTATTTNAGFYGAANALREVKNLYTRGASSTLGFAETIDVYGVIHDLIN